MSNTLSPTPVGTQPHPPERIEHAIPVVERVVEQVGLADRVALRLGLALVTWSRRPGSASPSYELVRQRERRELQAQRALYLTVPRR